MARETLNDPLVIPPRMRLALAAKGAPLLGVGGIFAAVAWRVLAPSLSHAAGALAYSAAALFLLWATALFLLWATALFLLWAAALALGGATQGAAVRVDGAVALASRRAGWSLRLPDGRFAEFILHNPWAPLVTDARYAAVHNPWAPLVTDARYAAVRGRLSRVIVRPPERQ